MLLTRRACTRCRMHHLIAAPQCGPSSASPCRYLETDPPAAPLSAAPLSQSLHCCYALPLALQPHAHLSAGGLPAPHGSPLAMAFADSRGELLETRLRFLHLQLAPPQPLHGPAGDAPSRPPSPEPTCSETPAAACRTSCLQSASFALQADGPAAMQNRSPSPGQAAANSGGSGSRKSSRRSSPSDQPSFEVELVAGLPAELEGLAYDEDGLVLEGLAAAAASTAVLAAEAAASPAKAGPRPSCAAAGSSWSQRESEASSSDSPEMQVRAHATWSQQQRGRCTCQTFLPACLVQVCRAVAEESRQMWRSANEAAGHAAGLQQLVICRLGEMSGAERQAWATLLSPEHWLRGDGRQPQRTIVASICAQPPFRCGGRCKWLLDEARTHRCRVDVLPVFSGPRNLDKGL